MKKQVATALLAMSLAGASAQVHTGTTTIVCDFEHVALPNHNHHVYNDSTGGGGFTSGNAFFPCQWDTSYGGYWSTGWACSAINDTTHQNYTNIYGCAAYKGYNNSNQYAIGTTAGPLTFKMTDSLIGKTVLGMYVCNSSYAYGSMKNGDGFEHAFAATTHDWFKLTIKKYFHGNLSTDSSEVYLADFRYSDTTQNYILKNWTWINLSTLGRVDSLLFTLHSSQNSSSGFMNTPAFFCIDNVTLNTNYDTLETSIKNYVLENSVQVFPNPSVSETEIVYTTPNSVPVQMQIIDVMGKEMEEQKTQSFSGLNKFKVDVSSFSSGIYFVRLCAGNQYLTKKIIKP
ncbi:MAG: DUF4465 domain-containing protein [Bacteroidetes bacterium]|nr:DUF4465 domain-containing protein [Bacteroidota bacterium]